MRERLRAVSVRVRGTWVILRLSNGTSIERDFVDVRENDLAGIHRKNGLDPRVRIGFVGIALMWPRGLDFELDNIVWGYPRPKGGQPLRRARLGEAATLIPLPPGPPRPRAWKR